MSKKAINILIILMLLCVLVILPSVAYASNGTFDASTYQPSSTTDATGANKIQDLGNVIISVIRTVGTIISVAILSIIGIKYMTGSVEEKAEYKKTMLPYVIGAVILFGITSFIGIIVDLVKGLI